MDNNGGALTPEELASLVELRDSLRYRSSVLTWEKPALEQLALVISALESIHRAADEKAAKRKERGQ